MLYEVFKIYFLILVHKLNNNLFSMVKNIFKFYILKCNLLFLTFYNRKQYIIILNIHYQINIYIIFIIIWGNSLFNLIKNIIYIYLIIIIQ